MKRDCRDLNIPWLTGTHLLECCRKAGLAQAFINTWTRMSGVAELYEHAEKLLEEDAPATQIGAAFDAADDEFHRREAFADVPEEEQAYDSFQAQDYQDVIAFGAAGVRMATHYICNMDVHGVLRSQEVRHFLPSKLWDRWGADPATCKKWYCGVSQPDWESLIQKHTAANPLVTYNLELAPEAPRNIGCGCRLRKHHGVGGHRRHHGGRGHHLRPACLSPIHISDPTRPH